MRRPLLAAVVLGALALPAAAQAAACRDQTPKFAPGAKFAGDVRHIIDGQTICVGRARNPETWIRVRLADLGDLKRPASWSAKRTLSRLSLGKYAVCTVSRRTRAQSPAQPVTAVCRVAGVSLAGRVRKANGKS